MKHTFLLDECLPTYSTAQRDVSSLTPFFLFPFMKVWLLRKSSPISVSILQC